MMMMISAYVLYGQDLLSSVLEVMLPLNGEYRNLLPQVYIELDILVLPRAFLRQSSISRARRVLLWWHKDLKKCTQFRMVQLVQGMLLVPWASECHVCKIKKGGGLAKFDESVNSLSSSIVCYIDLIPFECKRAHKYDPICMIL